MRWPWVSRVKYDLCREDAGRAWQTADAHAVRCDTIAQLWGSRYNDLLEKYHALKLAGAAPPPPPDPPVRQPLSTDLADEEWAMEDEAKPVEAGPFREDDD